MVSHDVMMHCAIIVLMVSNIQLNMLLYVVSGIIFTASRFTGATRGLNQTKLQHRNLNNSYIQKPNTQAKLHLLKLKSGQGTFHTIQP